MQFHFRRLQRAQLNATGHPMLLSLCEWGNDDVWTGWGGSEKVEYSSYAVWFVLPVWQ